MNEKPELLPCPFCGSLDVSILGNSVFYGHCHSCDTGTGLYTTREEAVNAWNTRAPVADKPL